MPWRPLPRIAFAVATFPFQPSSPADLPLELGDELYIIEQGGKDGSWYRGYLVAPPSLLSGLTSTKGQTLEARVFSGIFPRNCVEIRELLSGPEVGIGAARKLTNGTSGDSDGESGHLPNGDSQYHKPSTQTLSPVASRTQDGAQSFGGTSQSGILDVSPLEVAPRKPGEPKPPAPVPMLKIGDETPTSTSEPLVDEIASCLREWHSTNLHELLLGRQYGTLDKMSSVVNQLDLSRRQLLHDVLTAQEISTIRDQTIWNLVKGNRMLGGEIIVRDPMQRGRLLTGDDSAIEMTKLQATMSLLDSTPTTHSETTTLHHLLLEVKALTGLSGGQTNLTVSLHLKAVDGTMSPLTESFSIEIPANESFANLARSSKLKTIFTDLATSDVGEKNVASSQQVYLVIKVQSYQSPRPRPNSRESSEFIAREGTPGQKTGGSFNSAGRSSIRTGRRSLMFGAKARTPVNGEQHGLRESGSITPSERAPSRDVLKSELAKGSDVFLPRTIGAGVLQVSRVLRQEKEVDYAVDVWSAAQPDDEEDESKDMDSAISDILASPTGRYVRSNRASRIHLHLAPHVAADAESLIRRNPTSMHMITRTRRIGFSEAPTQERSDIYLTLSEAMIPKDGMVSHPLTGQVPLTKSTNLYNLQLTMEVRNSAGKRIENCIFPTSNSTGHTAWRTNVAEQGARWDQTICLKVPPEAVPGSHLIMSLANAPEFPFALSWMPLWHENAFIRDGHHTLLMHAYDKSTSSMVNGKGAYLSLPWSTNGKGITKDESVTGPIVSMIVETYLCSTEFSQDPVILSLINWKMQTSSQLLNALKKIIFVPEIEIVKQLKDVFDALFAILVQKNGDKDYEDLVFNDLVTVLGIVYDRRFNLVPLVDTYTETQFNYPFATSCLTKSYLRLLNSASDPQSARTLRATFKVGRQVLKFIMKARSLQKLKEEEIGVTKVQSSFSADMHAIFNALNGLMQNPAPALIGTKTLLVQRFHAWLPELLSGFDNHEVIEIAANFIDATEDVKGKLVLFKLVLILNCTQLTDVFATSSDQEVLADYCLKWLAPYWGVPELLNEQWRDQVRLCATVVAELSKRPTNTMFHFLPKIVASYCAIQAHGLTEKNSLSLLFPRTVPFQIRSGSSKQLFDEALLELAALMATISELRMPASFALDDQEKPAYILQTLDAHKSILSCEAYPQHWLSLHVYHHRATMGALEHISDMLTESFLPAPDFADQFDMELWKGFFGTLLKLVSSDALALETFAEQKRRAVWKIAGDVRENGANLLRRTWESIGWESSSDERRRYGLKRLGGYQVQYVPGLIPQIMELCLSVHEGLRRVAVEILQTMIVSEWALSEDLSLIETEMIASLDSIFKTKKINESAVQKLFIGELLGLFDTIATMPDDALFIALKELVATIDELMDLLVSAHGGPMTESLQMMRLMEFMKDMQKEDIFIQYVHELAENEDFSKNHTEAGLALRSHAELYEWDLEKLVPAMEKPPFPEQSAFERKEILYFQMIQHFEDGKSWSNALSSYKELADQYEHITYDYTKLARTQRAMGRIHEAVAKDDRHILRYFRVTYLGLGFPPSLRDKEYVFESLPSERMSGFTDRLQKLYPAAQIVTGPELEDLEGQFLLISNVSPHRELNHPVYQRTRVPAPVRDHLLLSHPMQFHVTAKRQMAGTDVKQHWVEKTVYTTAESFPTILKRSEVVATDTVRLSPLQTAIERVWRKTSDLVAQEKKAVASEDQNNAALTEMLLQLLDFDSGTTSCMAQYHQLITIPQKSHTPVNDDGDADLSDDELPTVPKDPQESALLVAIADHAHTIKRCLPLYNRPSLHATRDDLAARFAVVYPEEQRSQTPLSAEIPSSGFPYGSSPPRVSMEAGGTISINAGGHLRNMSTDRPLSPDPLLTSYSGVRQSGEKGSRMSLQFLKGAFPSTDRVAKESGRRQSRTAVDSQGTPTLHVNGLHGTLDLTSAPLDTYSASSRMHDQLEQTSTNASTQSPSKSRNRRSIFGGSSSRRSEDDGGKPTLTGGLAPPGSVKGRDGSLTGPFEDRPLTSGSSQAAVGDGGSQSARGIKKRFSILKLGKKKSEGSVRVSEILEE